jgi:hypothetical protein
MAASEEGCLSATVTQAVGPLVAGRLTSNELDRMYKQGIMGPVRRTEHLPEQDFGPRFEPRVSAIRNKIATHPTAPFRTVVVETSWLFGACSSS